jgi:hypothetical protein
MALKGPSSAFLAIFPIAARVCPGCIACAACVLEVRLSFFGSSVNHGKPTYFLVERKCKRESAQARTFELIEVREGGAAS